MLNVWILVIIIKNIRKYLLFAKKPQTNKQKIPQSKIKSFDFKFQHTRKKNKNNNNNKIPLTEIKTPVFITFEHTFFPHQTIQHTCSQPHLLRQWPPSKVLRPVKLERLSQEGVEWLPSPEQGCGVGRHGEGCHVGQLLTRVLAQSCLVENFRVLQFFCQSLQHGQGLAEVHLDSRISLTHENRNERMGIWESQRQQGRQKMEGLFVGWLVA